LAKLREFRSRPLLGPSDEDPCARHAHDHDQPIVGKDHSPSEHPSGSRARLESTSNPSCRSPFCSGQSVERGRSGPNPRPEARPEEYPDASGGPHRSRGLSPPKTARERDWKATYFDVGPRTLYTQMEGAPHRRSCYIMGRSCSLPTRWRGAICRVHLYGVRDPKTFLRTDPSHSTTAAVEMQTRLTASRR
jgi:hypothetical protein